MSIDEFFSKVDSGLKKSSEAKSQLQDVASQNLEFLKEVIGRVSPIAQSYKNNLSERGIHVELESNQTFISFTMRYADGGHRSLQFFGSLTNNRIEFNTSFTNDDGRDFKSTDGVSYGSSNWSDSIFESKLQKCIEDFLFYADRHGGLKA